MSQACRCIQSRIGTDIQLPRRRGSRFYWIMSQPRLKVGHWDGVVSALPRVSVPSRELAHVVMVLSFSVVYLLIWRLIAFFPISPIFHSCPWISHCEPTDRIFINMYLNCPPLPLSWVYQFSSKIFSVCLMMFPRSEYCFGLTSKHLRYQPNLYSLYAPSLKRNPEPWRDTDDAWWW